jgi:hypothetical protein
MFGQQRAGVLPGFSPADLEPVFWVDAALSSVSGGKLTNLGTGGSALDAQFGSTTGVDTNDPTVLSHAGTNYLYLPTGAAVNDSATVPDQPELTPTTSISYRFAVAAYDWSPGLVVNLGGHYLSTGNQRSSLAQISSTGLGQFLLSSDGITNATIQSTVGLSGNADGAPLLVRYDWLAAGPTVRFYTKPFVASTCYADAVSDAGWTQLGADVTASVPATLFSTTGTCSVAGMSGNATLGSHFATVVKVDGNTVVGVDFTRLSTGAETSFTATTGQTVTINRAASGRVSSVVERPKIVLGVDDYFEVPDNALLNFGANQDFTLVAVYRPWRGHTGRVISKQSGIDDINVGWRTQVSAAGADLRTRMFVGDGVTATNVSSSGSFTLGSLVGATFVRSTAGAFTAYRGSASGTVTSPGDEPDSLSNALPMRIGNSSASTAQYGEMELYAVAVIRRALTAAEVAAVNTYYGVA